MSREITSVRGVALLRFTFPGDVSRDIVHEGVATDLLSDKGYTLGSVRYAQNGEHVLVELLEPRADREVGIPVKAVMPFRFLLDRPSEFIGGDGRDEHTERVMATWIDEYKPLLGEYQRFGEAFISADGRYGFVTLVLVSMVNEAMPSPSPSPSSEWPLPPVATLDGVKRSGSLVMFQYHIPDGRRGAGHVGQFTTDAGAKRWRAVIYSPMAEGETTPEGKQAFDRDWRVAITEAALRVDVRLEVPEEREREFGIPLESNVLDD